MSYNKTEILVKSGKLYADKMKSKQRWKSQKKNQPFSGAYEYNEWSENGNRVY